MEAKGLPEMLAMLFVGLNGMDVVDGAKAAASDSLVVAASHPSIKGVTWIAAMEAGRCMQPVSVDLIFYFILLK